MTSDSIDGNYWFNTATHTVEHGKRSSWEHMMGPYATREEAEHALDKAAQRTQEWDDADKAWRDGS